MNEEPQEQNVEQLKEQMDELLINVRNEAIVQTANLYILGRQALLAGLGLGVLTLEAAQAFLQPQEHGEIAEADAEVMLHASAKREWPRRIKARRAASSLTDRAAVALTDSASTILHALSLRGTD